MHSIQTGSTLRRCCFVTMSLIGIGLTVLSGPAFAGISSATLRPTLTFQQTGDGMALTPADAYFAVDLIASTGTSFSSATLAYPGAGSPLTLTSYSPELFGHVAFFANEADMSAAFPQGTYEITALSGSSQDVVRVELGAPAYAMSLPHLSGASFTALQGMDVASAQEITFGSFATHPDADWSSANFRIIDLSDPASLPVFMPLDATTSKVVLPAGTPQPGHRFVYHLTFSSTQYDPNVQPYAVVSFDQDSFGFFSTALPVPEPVPAFLFAAGLGMLAGVVRRRRRAS